jgi:hypothetical protein
MSVDALHWVPAFCSECGENPEMNLCRWPAVPDLAKRSLLSLLHLIELVLPGFENWDSETAESNDQELAGARAMTLHQMLSANRFTAVKLTGNGRRALLVPERHEVSAQGRDGDYSAM